MRSENEKQQLLHYVRHSIQKLSQSATSIKKLA